MGFSNIKNLINNIDHIDVAIHATHLNYVNDNNVYYRVEAATDGANTWLYPYSKPQLVHHATLEDAIGRIIKYEVLNTTDDINEPDNVIKLTARITDKSAMEKVLTGIYYTCSVGSSITRLRCSECDQVITEDGLCEHQKGEKLENGNLVYWIIDEITYRENSFVNKPADSYSKIVGIDIGNGFIPYKEFLDHRETIVNELTMEDNLMTLNDAKLSASARKKLPDSAFCGPGKSFPAHDKAHVTAGLNLLNKSNFEDATKLKIKAGLYRKGKQYGITPEKTELENCPNLLIYRIDEQFSDEEVMTIADYFKENIDADLPEVKVPVQEDTASTTTVVTESFDEIKAKSKEDVIAYTEKLITSHNDEISKLNVIIQNFTKEIEDLKTSVTNKDTVLNSKEDELSKLLDDFAKSEEKYRQALVANIIDLKMLHNDEKNEEEIKTKYNKRQIHSLVDTISDLHIEINKNVETPKVENPTLEDNKDKTVPPVETENNSVDPELAPFYQPNWRTE